jgi:penicillin-binding protein 1A
MSDSKSTSDPSQARPAGTNGSGNGHANVVPLRPRPAPEESTKRRVRVRKLRVFALLSGLGLLAAVSTVFGMMMAVASDLPTLEDPLKGNSVILDSRGREIGLLTGNQRQLYVSEAQISPWMKHAIIAIEDRRFYTNEGVDLRGIARALYHDVRNKRAVQGGSTITQQFVKNALAAQDTRTLFVKLREAALAYHLTRKWSKERILRNYLNSIYFGNGAYGIESAARTYFGGNHPGCESDKTSPCASKLDPAESALLAGMVASPTGYDPIEHRRAAHERRDLVLKRMLEQGFIQQPQYEAALAESLPTRADLEPPKEDTKYPYFTSWIKQQVVDKLGGGQLGARRAFTAGLRVKTTLDSRMQDAATAAIRQWLPFLSGPRASLVAIQNKTGEVKAMVGGDDYATSPFNLATQGHRQPGSSFKPFVLAEALRRGISPASTWESRKKVFTLKGGEKFTVNNYDDAYSGVTTLANATTFSDNSVYAELGLKLGPRKVARMARRLGIRSPVSHNAANALGGLREGVTPLDMAHAYESFATGGKLIYGSLSPGEPDNRRVTPIPGPVGIEAIGRGKGDDFEPREINGRKLVNHIRARRVMDADQAAILKGILETVVRNGTAKRAQVPGVVIAGKTGTTEGYGDAWFVGWTPEYTIAIWVGYPKGFKPMETEFQGDPVAGGTYPAGIFKTFVESLVSLKLVKEHEAEDVPVTPDGSPVPGATDVAPVTPDGTTPPITNGEGGTGAGGDTSGGGAPSPPENQATPQAQQQATPAPTAAAPAPEGTDTEGGEAAPTTP